MYVEIMQFTLTANTTIYFFWMFVILELCQKFENFGWWRGFNVTKDRLGATSFCLMTLGDIQESEIGD